MLFVLLIASSNLVSAKRTPDAATCEIRCKVANIVEWQESSFPDIELSQICKTNQWAEGSSSLVLYTNADVKTTADNSDAALLSTESDSLITEYKLDCDSATTLTTWSDYKNFLEKGMVVKYIKAEKIKYNYVNGAARVTLSVRACSNKISQKPGIYTATQTITAYWTS